MTSQYLTSEQIDQAAEIICNASPQGTRWAKLGGAFRNFYRARIRALEAAGWIAADTAQLRADLTAAQARIAAALDVCASPDTAVTLMRAALRGTEETSL